MFKFSSSIRKKDKVPKKRESRSFEEVSTQPTADQIQQHRRSISMDSNVFEENESKETGTVLRNRAAAVSDAAQRYSVAGYDATQEKANAPLLCKAFLNGGKYIL